MCLFLIVASFLLATTATMPASAGMSADEKQNALRKVHYVAYAGDQRDWPTDNHPMVEKETAEGNVPIYQSLPDKPYEILGTIQASGGKTSIHIGEAAQAAGADAILVYGHKAFFDAGIKLQAQLISRGRKSGKITSIEAVLIRWKKST